jgi:hypothetical protein
MSEPLQTFELYLQEQEGSAPRFEALTCPANDVLTAVREMIADRRLAAIEVRHQGRALYTVRS